MTKVSVNAENWVDGTVEYTKVSDVELEYHDERYTLVDATDYEEHDGEKFDFFSFKVYRDGEYQMNVSRFRKDNVWEVFDGEISRMDKNPMNAVVKMLAMWGA